jgi:hypothetical protein
MGIGFWINSIAFHDGTTVSVVPDSITVLVGPNNVGKSRSLRDVYRLCQSVGAVGTVVVKEVQLEGFGTFSEFCDHFESAVDHRVVRRNEDHIVGGPNGARVSVRDLVTAFQEPHDRDLGLLAPFYVTIADTESRLAVSAPAKAFDALDKAPTNPIQALFGDDRAEAELSEAFRAAFSIPLFVNRLAGESIPIHCGPKPSDVSPRAYLAECRKIPRLEEQGDGMRSFAGCLLHVCTTRAFTLLIDEPEAFLHPPQARLLGTMLGKKLRKGKQIFLATHSGDLVRGLLDSGTANLTIVRLARDGTTTHPAVLPANDLKKVWADPALRFANILDGLFHERVVVCEGDADCRFYFAMLSALCEARNHAVPDAMLTSSNGKERFSTIVGCLRSLGVPVTLVGDFDLLRDPATLETLVSKQGGEWPRLQRLWKVVDAAVRQQVKQRTVESVRLRLGELLDGQPAETPYTKEYRATLAEAIRVDGPWDQAKRLGLGAVPPGDPTTAAMDLLTALRDLHIHVVETGELESFCRSASGKGASWVNAVLERDLAHDSDLESARRFVARVFSLSQSEPSQVVVGPKPAALKISEGSGRDDTSHADESKTAVIKSERAARRTARRSRAKSWVIRLTVVAAVSICAGIAALLVLRALSR